MGITLNDLAEQGVCFGADKIVVEGAGEGKRFTAILGGCYTEVLDHSNIDGDPDEAPWYMEYPVTCIWAGQDGTIHIEVQDYE